MRTLILEDEALAARQLEKSIKKLRPEYEIAGSLKSVNEAVSWFERENHPDLLFADIQLSDGISFELFERVVINCPVIFTTAYDEYAIRAFKINSIDYLLKPIDEKALRQSLEKFEQLRTPYQEQIDRLLQTLEQHGNAYRERFLVHHKNQLMPLEARQIAYFTRDELIFIHDHQNHKYISDEHSLDDIEALLDPRQFFRANRQFILHVNSIHTLQSTAKGSLLVQLKPVLQQTVSVSREKARAFKDWLGR